MKVERAKAMGCSNCARGLQAWHAVVRCEGVRACGAASVRRREFRGRRHRHKPQRLEDGAKPRRANSWKRANLQSLTDKPAGGSTARSLRLAARNGHTTMRRRAAEDRKGAGRHDGRLATNVCCRCIAPLKTRLPPSQARASSSASLVDFVSCALKDVTGRTGKLTPEGCLRFTVTETLLRERVAAPLAMGGGTALRKQRERVGRPCPSSRCHLSICLSEHERLRAVSVTHL